MSQSERPAHPHSDTAGDKRDQGDGSTVSVSGNVEETVFLGDQAGDFIHSRSAGQSGDRVVADQGQQSQGSALAVRGNEVAAVSLPTAGCTVEEHVTTTRASWREVLGIISKAAMALEYAHAHDQLHGTLQSSDIVIQDNGDCVLCDSRAERQTTPSSYTAPEQLRARSADRLTDLYRLGVVLYKLLTGREPFRASDTDTLCTQVRDDVPQPPRQLVHGLPKDVDSICLRLLAKIPADRIPSAGQLVEELQLVLRQFEDDAETGTRSHADTEGKRRDFVIIHLESAVELYAASPIKDSETPLLTTSESMQKLLTVSNANPVSWDGDELLFQLTQTASQDDAIGCTVAIGAGLLDVAYRQVQQSDLRYCVRVESAELDLAMSQVVSDTDRFRASDLTRRVPRVVGEATRERVQIDHATWLSIRRWLEHTEADDVAEVRTAADSEPLQVHIQPANPLGQTAGPASPLAIVKARWAQASEGLGQLVLIIGEEGTGKSRLVVEVVRFVEQSEQPEVVVWTCVPGRQGRSFHPLARTVKQQFARHEAIADDERPREAVKQYLSDIGVTSEESAELLTSVLEAEEAAFSDAARPLSSAQKEGVHDVILKWLGHATKQSPVLFIVEDLQWADPATLDLVSRLAANRLYEHLLLIATFRPEFETLWGSRAHQTQVALRRLSKKHVKEILKSQLASELVGEQVVEQTIGATGGVPLYIEAYLNRLNASGR